MEREEIRKSLLELQKDTCAYAPRGNTFCDCKFGYHDTSKEKFPNSEQNGCPELRTVVILLARMTDIEFEEIFNREAP